VPGTTASRSPSAPALRPLTTIGPDDAAYPAPLRDLASPPAHLWLVGRPELLAATPTVAIVGTRTATEYGERVTRELARALARAGACIVSGMARGIDAAAHRGALEEGGATIAVLGTGVEVPYPVGHRTLQRTIGERGLLVSEYPPTAGAGPGSFPKRNRIIAALASVTIVVEAGIKSGALNTAEEALRLGRTLAAVPGPIDAPQSEGANDLLRHGAVIIADVLDALTLVGLTPPRRAPRAVPEGEAGAVWAALGDGPLDADALCARSRLPASRCLAAVTELELQGLVECSLTGLIRRR
jgi:DNA processing protein